MLMPATGGRGAERIERMQSVNLYDGDNLIEEMDGNGGWPTSAQPTNLGCPTSRAFRDVGVCG
jgi:hypothetical protein